jgi:hypothetical protein
VTLDYRAGLAAAVLVAATYALGRVRLWLAARRERAQRDRAEQAEAERDREHAAAVGAARTAELTTAQRQADAAGEIAAKEIRNAPHDPDPIAELRAVDAVARRLRDADGARPDGGDGRAPGVPPRR